MTLFQGICICSRFIGRFGARIGFRFAFRLLYRIGIGTGVALHSLDLAPSVGFNGGVVLSAPVGWVGHGPVMHTPKNDSCLRKERLLEK